MPGHSQAGESRDRAGDRLAMGRLESAWRWWCLIGLVALAGAAVLLQPAFGDGSLIWFLANLLALSAVLLFVRRNLPHNRRAPEGPLLDRLRARHHPAVARGALIAPPPRYPPFSSP